MHARPFFLACLVALLLAPISGRAQGPAHAMDAEARRTAVERVGALLVDRYVFPDVGAEAARTIARRLEAGAYEGLDEAAFAERLTTDLRAATHDEHLAVQLAPGGAEAGDAEALAVSYRRRAQGTNYGYARVERLQGNVGYLDLHGFAWSRAARPTALAALQLLQGSDAIVVDLRRNGGGSPDMVRLLLSHFFAERTHLNSIYYRQTDATTEYWTLDDPPGPMMGDVPLVVLTSARTFSAGEEFAYDLQSRGRATLVGETTRGGANPGGTFPVLGRLEVFVPTGRAVNPVTGTNWEGVGVVPDVAVPADEAYARGLALARAAADARRDARYAAEDAARAEIEAAERIAGAGQEGGLRRLTAAFQSGLAAGALDEEILNSMGYGYLQEGRTPLAIAAFQVNVEAFSDSWNAHDSLAEAYAEANQRDLSVAHYERSLALNPENENARRTLERLRGE